MASIYKEGLGYAARVRIKGKSAYKAGFKTKAAAQAWVRETETTLLGTHQQMKGFGPMGTNIHSHAGFPVPLMHKKHVGPAFQNLFTPVVALPDAHARRKPAAGNHVVETAG